MKEKKVFENKSKDIENYLAGFTKEFGSESAFVLNSSASLDVEKVSTGIPGLDRALGILGVPRGRIVEVYGPESTGKSSLALVIAAEFQKVGEIVHYVDAEHAMDLGYAIKLGFNPTLGILSQPDNGEQALQMVDKAIELGAGLIVVDSVAALVPAAEIEGAMGDSHMGLQARLMSQAMRKITGNLSKKNSTIIFINQLRMKIGVVYGNPETTTGGNALKFYASVRLDVRKTGVVKKGEEIIGHTVKVKVVKNKVAAPFKETEIDPIYGVGFDIQKDWFDYAVSKGVIDKSGAWYSFEGERLGQGADNSSAYLVAHPEIFNKVKSLCQK